MQVKWSILQYFLPSLSYHLSLRPLFCLFLSGRSIFYYLDLGFYTSIFSTDGKVFTWGENQYGQLGIGDKNSYNTPLHVSCLMGIPISQVAAGFFHSFILSQSGAVYGWGRNRLVLLKWGV